MIARGFVEGGARVYISSRKADAATQAAAELSSSASCMPLPADLGTEAGVDGLGRRSAARGSQLHILVNNAGANWGAPLERVPGPAPWTRCWRST